MLKTLTLFFCDLHYLCQAFSGVSDSGDPKSESNLCKFHIEIEGSV